jgi:hypothetical protein
MLAVIPAKTGGDGWESNPPGTPQQRPADGFEDRVSDVRQRPRTSVQDQYSKVGVRRRSLMLVDVRENGCHVGCQDCLPVTRGPEPKVSRGLSCPTVSCGCIDNLTAARQGGKQRAAQLCQEVCVLEKAPGDLGRARLPSQEIGAKPVVTGAHDRIKHDHASVATRRPRIRFRDSTVGGGRLAVPGFPFGTWELEYRIHDALNISTDDAFDATWRSTARGSMPGLRPWICNSTVAFVDRAAVRCNHEVA